MNPSARLRSAPRAPSANFASGTPSTRTSPPVGRSSPPSRCNSVLLPDPDAPTIARRSPIATSRSTPRSTGTSSVPLRYVLRKFLQATTGAGERVSTGPSLIPQCLGGIHASGAEARVNRRDECKEECDRRDRDYVGDLQIGGQVADVIDAL